MNRRKPKKILTQSNGLPIYQLYIWIHDIHPIIWRRILVYADSTIADLHYTLQIAFGWEDLHLNMFHIHGQQYGVYHDGGISFMTDPKRVKLSDFNFYHNERFRYEYDFGAGWVHEIRVEAFLEKNDKYSYPYCQQGHCKAPPAAILNLTFHPVFGLAGGIGSKLCSMNAISASQLSKHR
jgi:hypothetical protein